MKEEINFQVNPDNRTNSKRFEEADFIMGLAEPEDWKEYKRVRLEALEDSPESVGFSEKDVEKARNASDLEWQQNFDLYNQFIVFLKFDGRAVGMAAGKRVSIDSWNLDDVFLEENFRGKITGLPLARQMIQKVIKEAKARGGKRIYLDVKRGVESLISVYKDLGFVPVASPKGAKLEKTDKKYWMRMEILFEN